LCWGTEKGRQVRGNEVGATIARLAKIGLGRAGPKMTRRRGTSKTKNSLRETGEEGNSLGARLRPQKGPPVFSQVPRQPGGPK